MDIIKLNGFAVIGGDKRTSFMQALDVFSKNKVLGQQIELCYNVRLDSTTFKKEDEETYFQLFLTLAKAEFGNDNIIFLIPQTVEAGNTIIKNTKVPGIVDPAVQVVSDGKKWSRLYDCVCAFAKDFIVESDQYFTNIVIKVKK